MSSLIASCICLIDLDFWQALNLTSVFVVLWWQCSTAHDLSLVLMIFQQLTALAYFPSLQLHFHYAWIINKIYKRIREPVKNVLADFAR